MYLDDLLTNPLITTASDIAGYKLLLLQASHIMFVHPGSEKDSSIFNVKFERGPVNFARQADQLKAACDMGFAEAYLRRGVPSQRRT
jgi:hypothetical protein